MSTISMMIQELDQEAGTTERVLDRVPDDRLTWKPHETAWTIGQLALHTAIVPGALAEVASRSPFPLPEFTQPSPATSAELVPALHNSVAKAKSILRGMSDADLQKTWTAVRGDQVVLALPVAAVLRSLMLNHWYHHRGQLAVYLRQLGIRVPSIYGPSGDENPFAIPAAAMHA
jgi:uncharacterized damage-inducible protein DinB